MTLADLEGRLTITVPEAGQLLSLGRDAAYAAAARGEIPTLKFAKRLVVSVPALLALLGVTPDMREAAGSEPTAIAETAVAKTKVSVIHDAPYPAA